MVNFRIDNDAQELEDINLFLPQQSGYHNLISKVYKNKIFYVKQLVNDEVTHILPFALISNIILGKKLYLCLLMEVLGELLR